MNVNEQYSSQAVGRGAVRRLESYFVSFVCLVASVLKKKDDFLFRVFRVFRVFRGLGFKTVTTNHTKYTNEIQNPKSNTKIELAPASADWVVD